MMIDNPLNIKLYIETRPEKLMKNQLNLLKNLGVDWKFRIDIIYQENFEKMNFRLLQIGIKIINALNF